jgi:hypothetical protein
MARILTTALGEVPDVVNRNGTVLGDILTVAIAAAAPPLCAENPYLRAKLMEFISMSRRRQQHEGEPML